MTVCVCAHSCLTLFKPMCSCHASLTIGFSMQEYWSALPFPSPGDPPDLEIKPTSPASPALAGHYFVISPPGKPFRICKTAQI